ncbi:hypothetical protein JAAARDRAFT_30126 [Jaapia argillacea MUCL 33604]|uniref:PRISE-like Rossmann-fold domain-containing protein n=1 Tax=Jaapia argillacea MUCL 33604 TaxID=933084 RepID=A0A067QFF2_9AGAM|nr:hypothetical protein JAAARDRAFT_30126 [Jaapia argillacea MUCL 33604]
MSNHALVFGASGISGIPILRNLLSNPAFSLVTGLTSRPFSLDPLTQKVLEIDTSSPKLQLVSGLDLSDPTDHVRGFLKTNVKKINTVTHVFFVAFKEVPQDPDEETRLNIGFVRHGIGAIDSLASESLKFVVLQTGGKAYGVQYQEYVEVNAPLKEESPRVPEPFASKIFYYGQVDALRELSKDKKWSWAEVRPDVIVGTVPRGNFMNAAVGIAIYLSMKSVLEPGSTVEYPGTGDAYTTRHSDSDHDVSARFQIHLALKAGDSEEGRKKLSGKAYNIVDGPEPVTWSTKWPALCTYFGLEGAPPPTPITPPRMEDFYLSTPLQQYVDKNKEEYLTRLKQKGLNTATIEETLNQGGSSMRFAGIILIFGGRDRFYDLTNAREVAEFTETVDPVNSYITQFAKMKELGIIP